MKRAQHRHGGDGGLCQRGRHVVVDAGQAQHADLQRLARRLHGLELRAAKALQPQHQHLAGHHLAHGVVLGGQLVADGGADEVGAVGVKAFGHQQVDMPQVHKTEVDGDLFRLGHLAAGGDGNDVAHERDSNRHPYGWCMDGNWMPSGGFQYRATKEKRSLRLLGLNVSL